MISLSPFGFLHCVIDIFQHFGGMYCPHLQGDSMVQLNAEVVGRKRNVLVMLEGGGNLANQSYGRMRRIGLV